MSGNHQNRQPSTHNRIPEAPSIPSEEPVSKTDATVAEPEKTDVTATVIGCVRLNVREKPNAKAVIVATIPVDSEIVVDLKNSTSEFYKVCNAAGIEGFCMRQYIAIRPQ